MDVSVDQLQRAVEGQHGGNAVFVEALSLEEIWNGKTVWQGVVHIFDLEAHPKATSTVAQRF
jgi:hypothetical protein